MTWLTPGDAKALSRASADKESAAWIGAVEAAISWVENEARPDLFSTDEPPVFQETPAIRLGTALLAHRWYMRGMSPLGTSQNVEFGGTEFLRQDPDIAKLLGIGSDGPFVFGAGRTLTTTETTTP